MVEVIKVLMKLLYNYKLYTDELPLDFDFKTIGIFYTIGSVLDEEGNIDFDTQIHIVGTDKLAVLQEVERVDKLLNNKIVNGIRIFRKNVYLNQFQEEGKYTYILEYYSRKFK